MVVRWCHHSFDFWVAATAFLVNMGFSAVPAALYVLYQRRDHFSTMTITVVYAAHAVGGIGSPFLGGHVSDWVGRKRPLVAGLLAHFAPQAPEAAVLRVRRVAARARCPSPRWL